jgi:hypothetical protein
VDVIRLFLFVSIYWLGRLLKSNDNVLKNFVSLFTLLIFNNIILLNEETTIYFVSLYFYDYLTKGYELYSKRILTIAMLN